MELPYKGSIVYCKNAAGQWTLHMTMEITPEEKARLCGYKNLACYERARRRAKRAKEKYRRKRLKEGK